MVMDKPSKKKFRIEDLNENTRKKIFIVSLVTMMTLIFGSWLLSFKNIAGRISSNDSQGLGEIKKQFTEVGQAIEQGQQVIEDLKVQFQDLASTTPTSTPATASDLSEEDLEKIKNIILENTQESPE